MDDQVTRWGIAGAGDISSTFATALSLLPASQHKVLAIASRSQERSEAFAKKFSIPKSYGSYEDMATNKDIDVVYLGVIHPFHLPLIQLYLNSGHHVLCETPLTVNTRQTREAVALAKEKGFFLMEGFWSRFFPVFNDLRLALSSGRIGQPRIVTSSIGFEYPEVGWGNDKKTSRVYKMDGLHGMLYDLKLSSIKGYMGGALLMVGNFCVMFSQLVYNHEKPEKIHAFAVMDQTNGVDDTLSITLTYSGNRVANIMTSKTYPLPNCAEIYGTKGSIQIPMFWSPEEIIINGETKRHPVPKAEVPPFYERGEGFMYEAQSVRECLLKGWTENPLMTLDQTLQIQEILEEIRNQIGLVYNEDII